MRTRVFEDTLDTFLREEALSAAIKSSAGKPVVMIKSRENNAVVYPGTTLDCVVFNKNPKIFKKVLE